MISVCVKRVAVKSHIHMWIVNRSY